MEAISHAGSAVGILSKEGVVLAAEKKILSKARAKRAPSCRRVHRPSPARLPQRRTLALPGVTLRQMRAPKQRAVALRLRCALWRGQP